MARHRFLRPDSKKRLKQAVESVEGRSAAEVVVAVRPWSGAYRQVDFLVGAVVAYGGLLFMMFSDFVFSLPFIVAGTAVLFALGVALSILATPLRMVLAGSSRLDQNVATAARARFYDLGVSSTRDRSGILVYVSLLEKRCRVLPDVGVVSAVEQARWKEAAGKVEAAVRRDGVGWEGVQSVARAIEALGPHLETALPRREDDINELPDLADEDE